MTRVEDGATSSSTPRPSTRIACQRRLSHMDLAYGKLEIDAASSAARLDFANTPDDAVGDSRFYDRQQAYVH